MHTGRKRPSPMTFATLVNGDCLLRGANLRLSHLRLANLSLAELVEAIMTDGSIYNPTSDEGKEDEDDCI